MSSVDIYSNTGELLEKDFPITAADHFLAQGILSTGVVLSLVVSNGPTIDHGFRWNILGSKGTMEITAPHFLTLDGQGTSVKVKLHGEEEVVMKVQRPKGAPKEVMGPAEGVWALYDEYAKGKEGEWFDLEDSLKMHRMIHDLAERAVV